MGKVILRDRGMTDQILLRGICQHQSCPILGIPQICQRPLTDLYIGHVTVPNVLGGDAEEVGRSTPQCDQLAKLLIEVAVERILQKLFRVHGDSVEPDIFGADQTAFLTVVPHGYEGGQ